MRTNSGRTSVVALVMTIVVVGIFTAMAYNRQLIYDYILGWDYQPSARMAEIKQNIRLTPSGDFLFQASQPEINTASEFNVNCEQNKETNNPIVGCYYKDRIYVFDVNNHELSGIEETTAAHELLHAVYKRLPDLDRQKIDSELESVYQRVKTPDLIKRMAYYEKTEPGERKNELHAILGTEFSELSPLLEDHYARYFVSRSDVVKYYENYKGVFDGIRTKLTAIEKKINEDTSRIESEISIWRQDRHNFIEKNNARGFTSADDFYAVQNELNSRLERIRRDIDSSNQDRNEYNQLIKRYNQLNMDINSTVSPAPTAPSGRS